MTSKDAGDSTSRPCLPNGGSEYAASTAATYLVDGSRDDGDNSLDVIAGAGVLDDLVGNTECQTTTSRLSDGEELALVTTELVGVCVRPFVDLETVLEGRRTERKSVSHFTKPHT